MLSAPSTALPFLLNPKMTGMLLLSDFPSFGLPLNPQAP